MSRPKPWAISPSPPSVKASKSMSAILFIVFHDARLQVLGKFSLTSFRQRQEEQDHQRQEDLERFERQQQQQQSQPQKHTAPKAERIPPPPSKSSHAPPKQQQQQKLQQQQQQQQQNPEWLYVAHQLVLPLTRVVLAPQDGRCLVLTSGVCACVYVRVCGVCVWCVYVCMCGVCMCVYVCECHCVCVRVGGVPGRQGV